MSMPQPQCPMGTEEEGTNRQRGNQSTRQVPLSSRSQLFLRTKSDWNCLRAHLPSSVEHPAL